MLSLSLFGHTLLGLGLSWARDRGKTLKALKIAVRSLAGLAPNLLFMVGLVGLVLALLPPELLRDLFTAHGVAGFALIAVLGALVTMPGPVAFPLAGSLLQMGVRLGLTLPGVILMGLVMERLLPATDNSLSVAEAEG